MAAIPPVEKDVLTRAFAHFDSELRGLPEWADWDRKESQKYAIEFEGKLYPPKQIIRMATGAADFSGGDQANSYSTQRGFKLVNLRSDVAADTEVDPRSARRWWWVNQGTTYKEEAKGGYLWAPATTKSGRAAQHHANVRLVKHGDVILHYANGSVRAISEANGTSEAAPRPEALPSGAWEHDGNLVRATYHQLDKPILLTDIPQEWRTIDAGPFDRQGGVKQGYLFPLSASFVSSIVVRFGNRLPGFAAMPNGDDLAGGNGPQELQFERISAVQTLVSDIRGQGFVFEPWQIASYVTALRTKPFVLLAGITGTGKSKLPKLVADATGGRHKLVPVRPDWTDSADVLGFTDLNGAFRPGVVLEFAKEASEHPNQQFVCILDEMNLARVEQYFAEVLSKIEDRSPCCTGGFASTSLIEENLAAQAGAYASIGLPSNFAVVGTVNMDESTHGFSRKVLDRAFTLELSDIDLTRWEDAGPQRAVAGQVHWPARTWHPRAISLAGLHDLDDSARSMIRQVIDVLTAVNRYLTQAQVQVGYRARDEVALYVLHAQEIADAFVTRTGERVNPVDLALNMKILPRLVGGSGALKRALLQLVGWAFDGQPRDEQDEAADVMQRWEGTGRPASLAEAQYPFTSARLCLMWDRFRAEGFTSYWL